MPISIVLHHNTVKRKMFEVDVDTSRVVRFTSVNLVDWDLQILLAH